MKKLMLLLGIVSFAALLTQCSSSKKATAQKVTYSTNIQPLVSEKCTPCHFPDKGRAKALNTYDAVKSNIDDMIRRIELHPGEKGFMPMKHERLNDSTINVFKQWRDDGLLE